VSIPERRRRKEGRKEIKEVRKEEERKGIN
jgi:hypothetical protein